MKKTILQQKLEKKRSDARNVETCMETTLSEVVKMEVDGQGEGNRKE